MARPAEDKQKPIGWKFIYQLFMNCLLEQMLLLNNIRIVFNIFRDNYCCKLREICCFVIITFITMKVTDL